MKFEVLVTLDLVEVTATKREAFYSELKKRNWIKIPKLTTAWKVQYDNGQVHEVVEDIVSDIAKVKTLTAVRKVEYACQIGETSVLTSD